MIPAPPSRLTPSPLSPAPPRRLPHRLLPLVALALALLALGALTGTLPTPAPVVVTPLGPPPAFAWHAAAPRANLAPPASAAPPSCTSSGRSVVGESVVVHASERICGNLAVYGASATIEGRVSGDVTITGGDLAISGTVDGTVTDLGGTVDLRSGARVGGDVRLLGSSLHRAPDTFIAGSAQQTSDLGSFIPLQWWGVPGGYRFPWGSLAFWALAGVFLAAFFPRQLALVRRVARRGLGVSFAAGIIAWIAGAILALVLFFTCLGIPLALLLVAALWVASVVGTVALGLLLGERLLGGALRDNRAGMGAAVLGVTLITFAETIPCLGALITLFVASAGLGAVLLTILSTRAGRYRSAYSSY
jgi:hypothetical protein